MRRAAPPGRRPGGCRERAVEEDDRDEAGEEDRDAEVEAPRPRAAAVDDVLLAEARVLGAEEARPRDHAADDEVDEPAERDDDDRRCRRSTCRRRGRPGGGTRSRPPGSSRTATNVAMRASRRSCDASATDSSLDRRVSIVSSAAVAIGPLSLVPGSAYPLYPGMESLDFSHEDVERAARYHRPRYLAFGVDLVLSVAVSPSSQWGWAGPSGTSSTGSAGPERPPPTRRSSSRRRRARRAAARVLARPPARAALGLLDAEPRAAGSPTRVKGEAVGARAHRGVLGRLVSGCARLPSAWPAGRGGRARARRGLPLLRRAGRARADLQPLPAARRRAARGRAARARRAGGRAGARRARRRCEPPHDEGERVRLGSRRARGASSSTTRCSTPRTRAS